MKARYLILVLLAVLAWPLSASAQPASDATEGTWGATEILARVQRMDPRLRVSAAEQLSAHIAKRRAKWNRVQGGVSLYGGYQVSSTGWLGTERMSEETRDQAHGAAVAEVRLPLYAGGRISAALEAADAQLRKARHDEAALRLELASAAMVAYAEALGAEEQTRVSEQALSRARELLAMTHKKRQAGIDTDADVARAELNLVRYQEEAAMRRGAKQTALTALRSALLLDSTTPLRLRGSLAQIAQRSGTPASVHPEVARSLSALEHARAQQRVAEADYLPSVDLFGTAQYGNTLPGAPQTPAYLERFGPLSGSAAAGVQAGWTVFDFFVTRDEVASAEAQVAARRAEHDVTVVALANRRNEAIRRQQEAAARLAVLEKGKQIAARALSLARARYGTGTATLTEVLDAELEAIRLETNRVQAGLQLALAHIDRAYAEGSQP